MSRLLERFRVRYFWFPGAMTPLCLRDLLLATAIDAKQSGWVEAAGASSELQKIFRLVTKQKLANKDANREPLIKKRCSVGLVVYPSPSSSDELVAIEVFAPSDDDCTRYEKGLRRLFAEDGSLKEDLPQSKHNAISLGLRIAFGKTTILLGGDVEVRGWKNAVKEFGAERLAAHCVKVSHHGSENGYCPGLWKVMSAEGKPIAVATSYQHHHLPSTKALKHIRRYVRKLFSTRVDTVATTVKPIPLHPRAPIRSREAVGRLFQASSQVSTEAFGICSLAFDDQGSCVSCTFSGGAGEISDNDL